MRRTFIPAALTFGLAIGLCWYVLRSTVGSPPVIPAVAAPFSAVPPDPPHPRWLQCDAVTAAPASDSAVAPIEAELYRAILAQAPRPDAIDAIVVEAVSSPIPRMRPDSGWTPWPASVEQLAREGEPRCFAQTADRFPAGAYLVAADQIQTPHALAAKFGGARQSFAFSRALFDSDHLDAVVYYDRFCYVGCGVGEWVWFHRDHPGDSWRIAGTRPRWMT